MSVDPNYVKWVQYSLNRILGAGLTTNGQITQLYREWVKEFQFCYQCSTSDGSVDASTQNFIISANQNEPIYITWVQTCLRSFPFGSNVAVDGVLGNKTKDAIRAFQTSVGLKPDAVIGSKTETALAQKTGTFVPGYYPGQAGPPPDPVQQRENEWLKNKMDTRALEQLASSWFKLYLRELEERPMTIPSILEREVTKCMLAKLGNPKNDFDYLTKQAARSYAIGSYSDDTIPEDVALDARQTIMTKIGMIKFSQPDPAKFSAFRKAVHDLYLEIDRGLLELKYQIHNSGSLTGKYGPYYRLDQWHERQKNRSWSIISCFPDPGGGIFGSGHS